MNSMENSIDLKIKKLLDLTDEFIFHDFYSHTNTKMWKIVNVYTQYESETLVLCALSEGIERALDIAIEQIQKGFDEFYGSNEYKILNRIVIKAKEYAIDQHDLTGHTYGNGESYAVHLEAVYNAAQKFIHLIPEKDKQTVLAACWVHDVIEDCRQTYNDVKNATSMEVAELAYALTNEKGKNRKERANDKYYEGIINTPYATFIKICDRIANYEYSIEQKSKMVNMYKSEMSGFIDRLYDPKYKEMFDYLSVR